MDEAFRQFFAAVINGQSDGVGHILTGDKTTRGMAVYSRTYLFGHCEHLVKVFGSLSKYLGEKNLYYFAKEYLKTHPPDQENLDSYGGGFPEFLSKRPELCERPELFWFGKTDWFWQAGRPDESLRVPFGLTSVWQWLTERGGDPESSPDPDRWEILSLREETNGCRVLFIHTP